MVVGNGFMCVGWMDGWMDEWREIRKEERKGEMRNRGMGGGGVQENYLLRFCIACVVNGIGTH